MIKFTIKILFTIIGICVGVPLLGMLIGKELKNGELL